MASPQRENGYTGIANEILDQLVKQHLNGTQLRIILVVWRFTYGFQRPEHELSVGFIAKATELTPRMVKREVKNLIDRKLIVVAKENTKADSRILKFNKDFEQWEEGNKTTPAKVGTNRSPGELIDPCEGTNRSPDEGTNRSPKKEKKENIKEIYTHTLFEHWNSKSIITHRTLTQKMQGHLNARLDEGYSVEDIAKAINNYAEVVTGEQYYWTHKWKLDEFLTRGFDKFKPECFDPRSFLTRDQRGKTPPKTGQSLKDKYKDIYL